MSKKVYCIAEFQPKPGQSEALFEILQSLEPNTLREDGCLQYRVTRQISSPFAEGSGFPIVFNEIWQDMVAFEAHCQRKEIVNFFEKYCLAEDGLAADWNVRVFSDEPENYDAPLKQAPHSSDYLAL
ncbi:putative quinol monooxygenase [Thiomicrorhabdus xiamenensis]|uniref:Antibiotic biosynthesis monooxygenase n=1 Tax=Thiomicrorhabdus xiamenensis TaxID=2739063 RepID=A0A7D4NPI3_9GAMM|nr:antibiotic biosynthesis monooxygenase [Thiomicrorhabdus xiamenensis]QKI88137.1 antibiotic biosynthesis monooxygenase [Thiomicrorhabdus xiamenensis]